MRLAILGAGGHGKVIADAAELSGWKVVSFFDDAWPGMTTNGYWPVVGGSAELLSNLEEYEGVVVGIGDNRIRHQKLQGLINVGARIVSIIHPSATISRHVRIEPGVAVFANAVVNPDAVIGAGSIINTGAVIEHDCRLGRCTHVSPNATLAGGVVLGQLAWVGANASVKQLVTIGCEVVIGMGSVVLQEVTTGQVVAGNPARPL